MPGEETSEALRVYIFSVYPNKLYAIPRYVNPSAYTDEDDYLRAGICYSTSPHPTLTDGTMPQQVIRPTDDYVSAIVDLEPGTTYYLRPFTENSGKVTYYRETSVKTVGDDLILNLNKTGERQMNALYSIDRPGTYEVKLGTWSITQNYAVQDFGYKTKGDGEGFTYNYTLPWESDRYFYLQARDIDSGILYRSNELYNR